MAQIERKWIQDQAINNSKIDPTDTYTITGLRIDQSNAVGGIGIGLSEPLDALHVYRTDSSAGLMLDLLTDRFNKNINILEKKENQEKMV